MVFPDPQQQLLRTVSKVMGKPGTGIKKGVGNPVSISRVTKGDLVTSAVALVEHVHYDMAYTTPSELGQRSVVIASSNFAATGCQPLFAHFSLGVTQEVGDFFIEEFFRGCKQLCRKLGIGILGADFSPSPAAGFIHITLMGQKRKKLLARSGAKVGDLIGVSGSLGASYAGLKLLKKLGRGALEKFQPLIEAHLTPPSQLKYAEKLTAGAGVTALIDLKDGLARDLHRLCESSKVGAKIEESKLPVLDSISKAADELQTNGRIWPLYGGEDFKLLFTIKRSALKKLKKTLSRSRLSLSVIGEVVAKRHRVRLLTVEGESVLFEPKDWHPFVRRHRAA